MRIDREFFGRFAQVVKTDDFVSEHIAAGDYAAAEEYIHSEIFGKPEDYYDLEKLRKTIPMDRRLSLRKMLIEDYLWAVISLPAGVFNPYAGVKTSILLMDKNLAQKTDYVLFAKVENDGFDLGAQRRPIEGSDLPAILDYLRKYKAGLGNDEIIDDIDLAHSVAKDEIAKDEIAKDGDYNLSGERYREFEHHARSEYPMVELGEICDLVTGGTPKSSVKEYYEGGQIKWLVSGDIH